MKQQQLYKMYFINLFLLSWLYPQTPLMTSQAYLQSCLQQIQKTTSNYKYSLSLGFSGGAIITASAFKLYKKNAVEQKIPWNYKEFVKNYPALLKQAISFRNKKFRNEHPYFCAIVKLYTATTAGIIWYEYQQARKTAELERIKNFNTLRINLSLTPQISKRAPQPTWVTNPLPVERTVIPFTETTIQDFNLATGTVPIPAKTAPELIEERKQEEAAMALEHGTVLVERNLSCLYCHTPFNDNETAYFYDKIPGTKLPTTTTATCPPTHLYHQGCINKWECSLNNGYAGDPKGCHFKCFASNAQPKERDIRANLSSVRIKLRQHDNPNYAPLEPVIDGIITNPHDEHGIPITECTSCKKSFKNGQTIAFANLHPQCGSNHLYHPNCFNYFRSTFDQSDPRARGGECWKVRGISCPAHCVDYHCDEKGEAHDKEPSYAKIQFTDALTPLETIKPEKKPESLLTIKNIKQLPTNKKMQCQGCGKKSDEHKNHHWTEFKCTSPECVDEEPLQYCHDIHEENEQKHCLKPGNGCSVCLKKFDDSVFKNGIWYKS